MHMLSIISPGYFTTCLLLLQVPYTIVRTHSDILHRPIMGMGDGMWMTAPESPTQNFEDGYAFAIATGSTAVLTTLQRRCHTANGMNAAICNYALAPIYSSPATS